MDFAARQEPPRSAERQASQSRDCPSTHLDASFFGAPRSHARKIGYSKIKAAANVRYPSVDAGRAAPIWLICRTTEFISGAPMPRLLGFACSLLALCAPARASDYLYVWGMETHDPSKAMPPPETMGRDFLAVFDVRPSSTHFGNLIAMLPVGTKAQMAHHTNYEMPDDGRLFASDYMSGDGYVFDVRQASKPKLVGTFGAAGPYTHSHSFDRLPNGNTLATYQFKGQPDVAAGALVELDPSGHVIRTSDASDVAIEPFIRPYSVTAVPALDRVVTTSDSMLPTDKSSHVIQIWRLSDLKLIKSVVLPSPQRFASAVAKNATEARLLQDGKSVLVVTSGCGLYRITDLSGQNPGAQFVYDFGYRSCGVPTVMGHYWVQTAMSGHSLVSVDVSDLSHVKEAGRLTLADDELPHWVSREPGGNRLVITGFGSLSTRVLFARINSRSGSLTLDSHRIDLDRRWPDGWNGPAMPHGSLFSR